MISFPGNNDSRSSWHKVTFPHDIGCATHSLQQDRTAAFVTLQTLRGKRVNRDSSHCTEALQSADGNGNAAAVLRLLFAKYCSMVTNGLPATSAKRTFFVCERGGNSVVCLRFLTSDVRVSCLAVQFAEHWTSTSWLCCSAVADAVTVNASAAGVSLQFVRCEKFRQVTLLPQVNNEGSVHDLYRD